MSKVVSIGHFPEGYPGAGYTFLQHGASDLAHPIGFSLADAMRLYWRVSKYQMKWTVSGTLYQPAYYDASGGGSIPATTFTVSGATATANFPSSYGVGEAVTTDETQLLLGLPFVQDFTVDPVYDTSGVSISPPPPAGNAPFMDAIFPGGVFERIGSQYAYASVLFDLGTGLYYPGIDLESAFVIVSAASEASLSFGFSANVDRDLGGRPLPITVRCEGQTTTIPGGYTPYLPGPVAPTATGLSCELDITPTSYWSYNGKYDTTTGEPL